MSIKRERDPLVKRVSETASREGLFSSGDRIIVAVSGGADSLALLHVMVALRKEINLEIRAASMNHGLRGDEGEEDLRFVAQTAGGLGIPFYEGRAEAGEVADELGVSLEDASRRVRYEFLAEIARQWGPGSSGPPRVAVGHTADDQAETVLMRLLEGTGLDGLQGMPVRREEDGWILVRPLLRISRTEVREYCARLNLEPRADSTNEDPRFRRNLVRLRLIPVLAEYNPRVADALIRLADSLGPENAVLEQEVERRTYGLVSQGVPEGELPFGDLNVISEVVALRRGGFDYLEKWVKRRFLRRLLWEMITPEAWREIGLEGVDRVLEAISRLPVGGRLSLPGGLVMEAGYSRIFFAVAEREEGGSGTGLDPVALPVPGEVIITEQGWCLSAVWASASSPVADGSSFDLDPAKIRLPLTVRGRRPGDVLYPAGMTGSKKLKDFFISLKVPRAERDLWPLVVDAEDRLVWVTNLRGDGRFAASPGLDRVIRLKARRE